MDATDDPLLCNEKTTLNRGKKSTKKRVKKERRSYLLRLRPDIGRRMVKYLVWLLTNLLFAISFLVRSRQIPVPA